VIGLLAGSRASEAEANFPHQLDVARRILREFPEARFLVPTTAATDPIVQRFLNSTQGASSPGFDYGIDRFDEMVPRCDLCITVSGTATLHVAGHGVPMIVVYRGSAVLWHTIGRWVVRTRTYALVNVLSGGGQIVPEFIPWYGSNAPVAACAIDMLKDVGQLDQQRARLRELVRVLDKPGASMNVARMALEMMEAGAFASTPHNGVTVENSVRQNRG
jgi:lipid-A-disaccharide synthase